MARFNEVMKNIRDFIENISAIPLVIFAGYVLSIAVVSAIDGKIEVSATLMGIFIISLLALSLPRLRVLEAFGVKANLDEQIRKAEITIDQLGIIAKTSARYAFDQMGGEQRCDINSRETIDALNNVLKSVKATDAEAAEIRRPLMDLIARDLFYVVQTADVHLRGRVTRRIDAEINQLGHAISGQNDPNEAQKAGLNTEKTRINNLAVSASATAENFNSLVDRFDADYPRTDDETRRLRNIIFNSKQIMSHCTKRGNITDDCAQFVRSKEIHRAGFLGSSNLEERTRALLQSRFADERLASHD